MDPALQPFGEGTGFVRLPRTPPYMGCPMLLENAVSGFGSKYLRIPVGTVRREIPVSDALSRTPPYKGARAT